MKKRTVRVCPSPHKGLPRNVCHYNWFMANWPPKRYTAVSGVAWVKYGNRKMRVTVVLPKHVRIYALAA